MLSFPNAKINLGLNIVSKRPDGYHEIESCFYPIPWQDALEILPADELKFTTSGLDIPGSSAANLCLKAYHLLSKIHNLAPVHIHLHKVIPMGAGLGGGSADGAFTLKMLNGLFGLNLSTEQLQSYATQLGSDCPFFIENKPTLAKGTGTSFSDTDLDLSGYFLALQNPNIHISTQEAYANIIPRLPNAHIRQIIKEPVPTWRYSLLNDFEQSVFPMHPKIQQLKDELYNQGAVYASMTGSGSTVYGLFQEEPSLEDYRIFKL